MFGAANRKTLEVAAHFTLSEVVDPQLSDRLGKKIARYRSGYALRIPRFKRVRRDKSTREADNLERLKRLYKQMHR